ncbi:MAG: LysM peptidoglycan-binding domain-containing protein [Anaerolineales bacterium]|nr:LysM peptidoglycan-binding domain-containing protein [Anaerolineales bacterium]
MSTKPFLRNFTILMVLLLILTSLAACRQPASTLPSQAIITPTEGMGQFPTAGAQTALPSAQAPQATPGSGETTGQATAAPAEAGQATEAPQAQAATPPAQAPAEPPKEFPKPTAGIPTTYTLQKGEYVYCIARRFNVNPSELLALNGLGVSTVLSPGTVLKIPQTGNPFVTERALIKHPTTYTVQAGDTVYTIACAFGDVSPDMIALVNGLKEPYSLSVGQKLDIP